MPWSHQKNIVGGRQFQFLHIKIHVCRAFSIFTQYFKEVLYQITNNQRHFIELCLLVSIFQQSIDQRRPKILLCAPSNGAIDELARRLINDPDFKGMSYFSHTWIPYVDHFRNKRKSKCNMEIEGCLENIWSSPRRSHAACHTREKVKFNMR